MGKFFISNENMTELIKICRTVTAKDSKVVLNMGLQEVNDNVVCEVSLTTEAEQVRYRFLAKKPEDFAGAGSVDAIAVNAVKFLAIAESVLAFKEDVYLSPEGAMLVIGVSNKAKSSVALEAQAPSQMAATQPLFRLEIDGKELSSVLSKGCSFASDEKGALHNAVIQLSAKDNLLRGYSTDGNSIARAEGKATYKKDSAKEQEKAQIEAMNTALEAVCAKNGVDKDAYPLIIPKESIQHLAALIGGAGLLKVNVDENHIHVMVGNSLVYSITQANEAKVPIQMVEGMAKSGVVTTYGLDAGKLSEALGFINKNLQISGNNDTATVLSLDSEDVLLSSGIAGQFESRVKAISAEGSEGINLDGVRFKTAVDALSRGNLVADICEIPNTKGRYVTLRNGTAEKKDNASFVIVLQVIVSKVDDAESAESEAEAEA